MRSQIKRILALVVLVAFVSGCASYHPATLPSIRTAEDSTTARDVIKVGQSVRVTLVNGERIEGKVASVTEESLSVGQTGNFGYTESTFAASEISRIETESWSKGSKVALYTAAGVFVVGAVAIAAYVDGLADGLSGSK